ncbi:MAG: penicillin acylase family protein [Gammaproteobacteria bacterium]|nr:penicillin acylase family protein [Gammaproteobacteria bacterium]
MRTLLACLALAAGPASLADGDASFELAGLEQPAEIIVDEWGVPHIYAGTHYDAFFAQGFNAARDRLWQIDTWRRRGLGLLAEVFGAGFVEQDRANRLFLYRGDMYREWLAYGSDAKRIAEAFTAGINAYVDLLRSEPERMPVEFSLLGYAPSRWDPADVVRVRSHGLSANVTSEARAARIACELGVEAIELRMPLEPRWKLTVPAGLDPCVIQEDTLAVYRLAKASVSFDRSAGALARVDRGIDDPSLGSNNWVVAPGRTATGRAILANDPHRSHSVPSLRYVSHLVAPDLDVIGAGEPGLPGISIGHNQRIAFGLTIFRIDQEDLYVYERSDGGYRYGSGSEPLTIVRESIPVAGQAPVEVELAFTRHGPVIAADDTHLFAVRAAWLDEGMAPYFGSVEYMRAENWREFVGALNRWGAPPENQVYADIEGNIGYKPAGLFPVRRNWDGILPVPGDGRYEWDGYHDMDVLPVEYNPARGYAGTANSMNLPEDYPIDRYRIGFEWSTPWRYNRLREVLAGQQEHTLADSVALQRDYTSVLAREIVALLPVGDTPAYRLLAGWDARLVPESAAAALYAIWYHRHLNPALATELAPSQPERIAPLHDYTVLERLRTPTGEALALATLETAWAEAIDLLGEDSSNWRWGDLHRMQFEHPLLERAGPELATQMRFPSYPRGGSGNTTNNTSFDADDFLVQSGASWRMVVDVGNWDAARMTNAPGQSGDPRSRFYDNLLEGWATDGSFPLLYSRERILEHEAFRIRLLPAGAR